MIACLSAPAGQAAGAAPPGEATVVSGLDVVAPHRPKAPPPRKSLDAFVGSVGVISPGAEQLAIWTRSLAAAAGPSQFAAGPSAAGQTICPLVAGLAPEYARFIIGRLRVVGGALGAPIAQKDCGPSTTTLAIVFPDDAGTFIKTLARDKPQAFGFDSPGALAADLTQAVKPIRAWYGVETVVAGGGASRLTSRTRTAITQVLIIVDRSQTKDIDMGQLTDYIAMAAFAQINPDRVPPEAGSILNLFRDLAAGKPPQAGMTRLDAAYLQALYAISPRQPGWMQNQQIAARIARALASR